MAINTFISENLLHDLQDQRASFAKKFLNDRNLSLDQAHAYLDIPIQEKDQLLLTSSPVQGIANATSDIDYILINDEANTTKHKMAMQKFVNNEHMELMTFTHQELEDTLHFLKEISNLSISSLIHAISQWGENATISKKYIERIINGVNTNSECPFLLENTPALAMVWATTSYQQCWHTFVFSVLAFRAKKYRMFKGYMTNYLLFLMDTLLSANGYVFNNKKWFFLRWTMLKTELGQEIKQESINKIDQYWQSIVNTTFQPDHIKLEKLLDDFLFFTKILGVNIHNSDSLFESNIVDSNKITSAHQVALINTKYHIFTEENINNALQLSLKDILILDETMAEQVLSSIIAKRISLK